MTPSHQASGRLATRMPGLEFLVWHGRVSIPRPPTLEASKKEKIKKDREIERERGDGVGVGGGEEKKKHTKGRKKERKKVCFAGWLLNVPATGECISETDLLRQFYVLPH